MPSHPRARSGGAAPRDAGLADGRRFLRVCGHLAGSAAGRPTGVVRAWCPARSASSRQAALLNTLFAFRDAPQGHGDNDCQHERDEGDRRACDREPEVPVCPRDVARLEEQELADRDNPARASGACRDVAARVVDLAEHTERELCSPRNGMVAVVGLHTGHVHANGGEPKQAADAQGPEPDSSMPVGVQRNVESPCVMDAARPCHLMNTAE